MKNLKFFFLSKSDLPSYKVSHASQVKVLEKQSSISLLLFFGALCSDLNGTSFTITTILSSIALSHS